MASIASPEQLREFCAQAARSVTRQIGGIELGAGNGPPRGDERLVFAPFTKGVEMALALRAETGFFQRISCRMMRREWADEQDMEDSAKEYFNVLCGGVVAALYRSAKAVTRFDIPTFHKGGYRPQGWREDWSMDFLGDNGEHARLICYMPPRDDGGDTKGGGHSVKKRVMVVDDSRIIGMQMEAVLEDTDYKVVAYCRDGSEAISCYDEVKPDLVTMDILMPGMDGLETAQTILEEHPDAKIIMLSSLAYEESFEEARAIGAKHFLAKPFSQAELLDAFAKALSD